MKVAKLKQADDQVQDALRELDRRGFLLKTLCDATLELSDLEDTEKMIEIFLLISMGSLGITQGFVLKIDTESLTGQVTSRGLDDRDIRKLYESVPQIVNKCFSGILQKDVPSPMEAHLIVRNGLPDNHFLPHETKVLIDWNIDKKYVGLMGLKAKILDEDYSDEDIEFLFGLTNSLLASIKNARSMAIIRQLNLDIQQKNIEQEDALKEAERTQWELDSRVFHLNALYDTARELSNLTDSKKIMETFLLMTMGTLSVEQGYIFLADSIRKNALVAYRGIEKENVRRFQEADLEKLGSRLLETAKNKGLTPMDVQRVSTERLLESLVCPIDESIGLLFMFDDTCVGFMGLGSKITRQRFSEEEQELLLALGNNFTVFLKNARSFETIEKLNTDLEKRNIQLNKTIEELSASRLKVDMLERARDSFKSFILGEKERARHVSLIDLVLILIVALGMGVIFNLSKPDGINLIPHVWVHGPSPQIDVHEAKPRHDAGASLFVDARPANTFKMGYIRGALNLPLALFDFVYMMKLSERDRAEEIIVYGRDISRRYDEEVAFKLASRGHANVRVLLGGLSAWQKKGYPLGP